MKMFTLNIGKRENRHKPKPGAEVAREKRDVAANTKTINIQELISILEKGYSLQPGISTRGTGKNGTATSDDITAMQVFAWDIDNKDDDTQQRLPVENWLRPDTIREIMKEAGIPVSVIYHTFSSNPDWPRYRFLTICDEPIEIGEVVSHGIHAAVRNYFIMHGYEKNIDAVCMDSARLNYGSRYNGVVYPEDRQADAATISKADLLRIIDHINEITPADLKFSEQQQQIDDQAAGAIRGLLDPRKKPGFIGAFCRARGTIANTIDTDLTDCYERGSNSNRYTHIGSSTKDGFHILPGTDGQYGYSHHSTDPIGKSKHAFNSYDLVMDCKFGDLPKDEKEKKMAAYCRGIPEVMEEFKKACEDDFHDLGDSAAADQDKRDKATDKKRPSSEYFHIMNPKTGTATGVYDQRIADYIRDYHPLFFIGGFPYLYEGGRYIRDDTGAALKTLIRGFILPVFVKAPTIKRIYDLLLGYKELQTDLDHVNLHDKEWICFKNGYYDPRRREIIPHDPKYRTLNMIPYDYDPNRQTEGATVDQWLDFITPEADAREMFLQYAGICLTVNQNFQKMLFLRGEGGSGKSGVIRMMEELLGDENTTNVSLENLQQRFFSYQLVGKLLNACGDQKETALSDPTNIKLITGGDGFMVEAKGKDSFRLRPYAKLLFSANKLPLIRGEESNGFYRRLLVLVLDRRPENPDAYFYDKIEAEAAHFLRLVVEAYERAIDAGAITESRQSKAEVAALWEDSDTVQGFLAACTTQKDHTFTRRSEAYNEYEYYCRGLGRQPLSKTNFFRSMTTKGSRVTKIHGYDCYAGFFIDRDKAAAAQGDFDVENDL